MASDFWTKVWWSSGPGILQPCHIFSGPLIFTSTVSDLHPELQPAAQSRFWRILTQIFYQLAREPVHANNLTWLLSRSVHVSTLWFQRFSTTSNHQGSQLRSKWRSWLWVIYSHLFCSQDLSSTFEESQWDNGGRCRSPRPGRGVSSSKSLGPPASIAYFHIEAALATLSWRL